MVTVTAYKTVQTDAGESYIRLLLTGGLSLVKSSETGKHYATCRKCSISSTFDEDTAKLIVGTKLPGQIIKQDCPPYEYMLDNGETIELSHRWSYTEETVEETAINGLMSEINTSTLTEAEA